MQNNFWVVYIESQGYEKDKYIEGIVTNLETFKKLAIEKYGILSTPIKDTYGKNSLHYEYSVKKSESYYEYYHLVAEPTKLLKK